jgi:hypothetical protein
MMDWNSKSRVSFALLAAAALLVAVLGIFLPDIRDRLVFKPRRDKAEAAVTALALKETALRRSKGHYDAFSPANAVARMRALGLADFPAEDFLFDASLTPDKSLRLRALPRPTSVQDLRVSPHMYVAELAPAGGVAHSGWYP